MAWQVNLGELGPGRTIIFWYSYGSGPWKGIHVYAGKSLPFEARIPHLADTITVQPDNALFVHDAETLWVDGQGYKYRVQITNRGPSTAAVELWVHEV